MGPAPAGARVPGDVENPAAAHANRIPGWVQSYERVLRSGLERVNEVRSGLPYSDLELLQSAVALSAAETARALGIPERTLARRKQDGRLSAEESDRLDRVTRVVELGRKVLGDEAKIRGWLHAPSRALGGVVPIELLDTDRGVRAVEEVLLRLEHGMYG